MRTLEQSHLGVVTVSFIGACLLTLLPLPHWALFFKPLWLAMVLIYWVLAIPHRVNIGIAWSVGILLDVIDGVLLGEHALAMTIVAYLTMKLHRQIRMFPLIQQAISIMILLLIYQLILIIIQGFAGEAILWAYYFPPLMTTALLWPWLFVLLRGVRRRFEIK